VPKSQGETWAKENNNMIFIETSALYGNSFENAIISAVKVAIKRQDQQKLLYPVTI
jgi:hypothetical protein